MDVGRKGLNVATDTLVKTAVTVSNIIISAFQAVLTVVMFHFGRQMTTLLFQYLSKYHFMLPIKQSLSLQRIYLFIIRNVLQERFPFIRVHLVTTYDIKK